MQHGLPKTLESLCREMGEMAAVTSVWEFMPARIYAAGSQCMCVGCTWSLVFSSGSFSSVFSSCDAFSCQEFNLIDRRELAPLQELIEKLGSKDR